MPSGTPRANRETGTFRITHIFHPLFDREFEVATLHQNWAEDRVFFYDEHRALLSIPLAWTSLAPPDPFVVLSSGRAPFRIQDLIELAGLLRRLLSRGVTP